jgi:K+-sensing histidine kinase KdpD
LVLVVVAVGTAGDRIAGVLAALSAAAAFDFFLTAPYLSFAILDRDDVETAVLLLAIGVSVTEIALWGRGQKARSLRREGYLTGVAHTARMVAEGSSQADLVATVERMISDVLDLDDCGFDAQPGPQALRPVLGHDGVVTWGQHTVDVRRDGLPTMDAIALPAGAGRFLLTASSRVRRPDREQLLVAVTLAEQVGAAAPARQAP